MVSHRWVAPCWVLLLAAFLCPLRAWAGAQSGVHQQVRSIDVAAQTGDTYRLEVVAAPKLTTTIRLPDNFLAEDVLCTGACVDASDASERPHDAANWLIEKRPHQQSLHVWPARLPGPGNPPSAFATNIYVATEDGKAYNIELKLLDLGLPTRHADAVVNVKNSREPGRRVRLQAQQQQCRQQAREELAAEVRNQVLAGLIGATTCKTMRWQRPARDGMLMVRIEQLCRSASPQPMLWTTFSVENRGRAPLQIDAVRLEPGSSFQGESEESSALSSAIVGGKERIYGVAMRSFKSNALGLRDWRLEVVPEPNPSAQTVSVAGINF